jgi:diguanylate cyclase (GGDEF)-like protein
MARASATQDADRLAAGRTRPPRRAASWVLVLAAALAVPALLAVPRLAGVPPLLPGLALPWWALAVAFIGTESVVMHIQARREAQTISLSELPLVVGLCFAPPLHLLLGRLAGSALVFVAIRRSTALKTGFNLALIGAETVVALGVFRTLPSGSTAASPWLWAAAYTAAHLANAVSLLALGIVIAVHEGWARITGLPRDLLMGDLTTPVVVTMALIAVTSLAYSATSAILLLAGAAALLLGYRSYAALADRHLSLERVYGFTRAVSTSPEAEGILRQVLTQAKELLHAEHAEVAFVDAGGDAVARVRLSATGRLSRSEEIRGDQDRWLLAQALDARPVLLPRSTKDPRARAWLAARSLREAIAVPLHGATGVVGIIIVADRMGEVRGYDESDVAILSTVAGHAGVALQNGELVDRLRHEASHDALTGLANRAALQRHLVAALDDIEAGRSRGVAVLLLDLDDFKEINDTLGHGQGDRLLVEVAARLARAAGPHRFAARLGGDEFAVVTAVPAGEEDALHLGRHLLHALEPPVDLEGLPVSVRGSLGVALAPAHADDVTGLLKRADLAMYDAKTSGRGLRLYQPGLDTHRPDRLVLVSELRAVVTDRGIGVHVQPQARPGTGDVVAVEALARWPHPSLGLISPEEFIPLAERHGLIGPLTTQVLDTALAACARWRQAGHEIGVAVNLSAQSLNDPDLVSAITDRLLHHRVPSQLLTLEVTESSVMTDPARAVTLLHILRDLGIRLSVDDFGTGYSSLSYLQQLPVHEVKIDRSFIGGDAAGGKDLAIVRAIIDLGHHLGLQVVAEGVEDQPTWDLLGAHGCDLVQGWHLSRPMPIGDFLPWLTSPARRITAPQAGPSGIG